MTKQPFSHLMTYSLLATFAVLILFVGYVVYESNKPPAATKSNTAAVGSEKTVNDTWQSIYPNTRKMTIGGVVVDASVADTWPLRIEGLSNTPYIPEHVVKLFVFDSPGLHSIWMKEMNYAIDIIWLNGDSEIVYMVEGATPESYPAMFTPKDKAKYVIETADGFIKKHGITNESKVVLPEL